MTFPQVVTPECSNRGSSPKFAWIPPFETLRAVSIVERLKACGNDGLWQCYQPPLRSKLRGIDPKEIKRS